MGAAGIFERRVKGLKIKLAFSGPARRGEAWPPPRQRPQIPRSRRSFLIESPRPRRRLHARRAHRRSAADRPDRRGVRRQGSPAADSDLEQHKEGPDGAAAEKKLANLGCSAAAFPKSTAARASTASPPHAFRKSSAYASFSVSVGAHSGIGTLPIVYFGTEEQKKNICRSFPPANGSAVTASPNRRPVPTRKIRARARCFRPTASIGC
jgi:hypothetical protein